MEKVILISDMLFLLLSSAEVETLEFIGDIEHDLFLICKLV